MRKNTDFDKIAKEFDKTANPEQNSFTDDRLWKPERDKAGNATATIRFLPTTPGDDLPWVKVFSHGFQGPTGRWYIENSLTTIGQPDPVSELNSRLWNTGIESNKDICRKQKRRLQYYSNILVVDDPKHPENNGKVMIFKYGKKIFDKLMDKARPTFEDEEPVNVFDYWAGADFKLRMKNVEGFPNYDSSTFAAVAPIADTDEEILAIAEQQHKLSEFTDPKNFKSYEELSTKLNNVLNGSAASNVTAESVMEDESVIDAPAEKSVKAKAAPVKAAVTDNTDEDDMMSYFQSIADEDN